MASRVTVYQIGDNKRSRAIAAAMLEGITKLGDLAKLQNSTTFNGIPDADIAVFYGFNEPLRRVFDTYVAAGLKAVCVDLGYWGRKELNPILGYHKISVNDRHPTAYFQRVAHDGSRAARFRLAIAPWRAKGEHILLAGMGEKSAECEGFEPEQWEREAIAAIRQVSDRPIIYRPKPSWKEAQRIEGAGFAPKAVQLESLFPRCHAVVTHHSNVAVEALVAGIPVFSFKGAGAVLSSNDLSAIEKPIMPGGRHQFVNDLAWTQFHNSEMKSGVAWRHLKDEGLIP